MKRKFWNWVKNEGEDTRTLYLTGEISDETWFGDEVTYDGHYHNSWLSSHFPENLLRGGRNDD